MDDARYRTWDTRLKALGLVGIFLGGATGACKYVHTGDEQAKLETAKFSAEQNKPLLEKQIELYFQASRLSAKISVEPDNQQKDKDIQEFEELYYGPMVIVEDRQPAKDYKPPEDLQGRYAPDRNVESRMIAYHNCLIEHKCPEKAGLQTLSLQLADACRLSLLQTAQAKVAALKLGVLTKAGDKK